ncbi:MAG: hypothetical protein SFU98_17145 [Leptospiraceae bacterium]|nr:hypothetical protein [Leptospiraceae bacterium]
MRKFVGSLNLFLILFTTTFLDSGVACLESLNASLICKCNHGSRAEIHQDDLLLSKHKEVQANLPDCHKAKKGAAHVCACKKTSDSLSKLFLQKPTFFLNETEKLNINLQVLNYVLMKNYYPLTILLDEVTTPPPKCNS